MTASNVAAGGRVLAFVACALALVSHPARADDTKAFVRDVQRGAGLRSFRLHVDAVSPISGIISETLAYVAPDTVRVDVPGKHFSAVIIGSSLWLRGRSGRWRRGRLTDAANALAAVRDTTAIADNARGKHVRFRGTESIHGVAMHVYDLDDPDGNGSRSERIWIGDRDGFPHRIEQRNGALVSTGTYFDFDRVLSVTQ